MLIKTWFKLIDTRVFIWFTIALLKLNVKQGITDTENSSSMIRYILHFVFTLTVIMPLLSSAIVHNKLVYEVNHVKIDENLQSHDKVKFISIVFCML